MQPDDPILDLLDFSDAQVFAVVDGAMVEDLPSVARRNHLSPQALYYDHRSHIGQANGPHLIHCEDVSVIVTVRNAFPPQAVVWWVWAEADEGLARSAMFRHLRGLGMVEIPEGYPKPPRPRAPMERVLFRHADARVIARVLPVLDPDQRARLYGKAGALVLEVEGKLRRALVPAGLPLAPPGFLRLTADQLDAMRDDLMAGHVAVVSRFLRRNAPYETQSLSDDALDHMSAAASKRGRELGLQDGPSLLMFALLVALTGGKALDAPEIEAAMTGTDTPPDQTLKQILDAFKQAETGGV
jgi:hypothetical protein